MGDVRVTGDFSKLRALAQSLEAAARPAFREAINKQLSEEARTQAQLGFERSRDPYGAPWKPVARGGQPLLDSGRLRNSITPTSSAQSFTLSTDVAYAATHQHGATIKAKTPGKPLKFKVGGRKGEWRSKYEVTIPKRQFMPEGELGPIWFDAFEKVVTRSLKVLGLE